MYALSRVTSVLGFLGLAQLYIRPLSDSCWAHVLGTSIHHGHRRRKCSQQSIVSCNSLCSCWKGRYSPMMICPGGWLGKVFWRRGVWRLDKKECGSLLIKRVGAQKIQKIWRVSLMSIIPSIFMSIHNLVYYLFLRIKYHIKILTLFYFYYYFKCNYVIHRLPDKLHSSIF